MGRLEATSLLAKQMKQLLSFGTLAARFHIVKCWSGYVGVLHALKYKGENGKMVLIMMILKNILLWQQICPTFCVVMGSLGFEASMQAMVGTGD